MGKKLTKEIFIERSLTKHGDKYDYSNVDYVNNSTKVEITCPEHGGFLQAPYNHMIGQGCQSCAGRPIHTNESFIKESKKIHGNKYDYSNSIYVSSKLKVIIICPEHGVFQQSPNSHMRGNGCKKCAGKRIKKALSDTTESFILKSIKVHGDNYDYSKVIYRGNKENVTIICPIHGDFEKNAGHHLAGQGCRACSGKIRLTQESFIERASKEHESKYDYSKSIIKSKKDKVRIICKIHGEFTQLPGNHISGQGCPECAQINRAINQRYTKTDFLKSIGNQFNNKYDYSKLKYVNSQTKVEIICPHHGSFFMKPNSHFNGHGCPKCGRIEANRNIRLDYEEFLKRVENVHHGKYEYVKSSYVDYTTKMKIICDEHGEFEQKPHSHISMGTGCPECGYIKSAESNRVDFSIYLERFKEVHGDEYEYFEETFDGATSKMKMKCSKHSIFYQTPTLHQSGSGCKKCGYDSMAEATSIDYEDFKSKSKEIHGDEFDYSKVKWLNQHEKVEIICKKHGSFMQTARGHIRGSGCPTCNASRGEKTIKLYLEKFDIDYTQQQKFKGLKDKGPLKCDFYLPEYNLVIEYNGQQHYDPVEQWGGVKALEQSKKRDKIKEDFCKENLIGFEVIKYDEDITDRLEEILCLYD